MKVETVNFSGNLSSRGRRGFKGSGAGSGRTTGRWTVFPSPTIGRGVVRLKRTGVRAVDY